LTHVYAAKAVRVLDNREKHGRMIRALVSIDHDILVVEPVISFRHHCCWGGLVLESSTVDTEETANSVGSTTAAFGPPLALVWNRPSLVGAATVAGDASVSLVFAPTAALVAAAARQIASHRAAKLTNYYLPF